MTPGRSRRMAIGPRLTLGGALALLSLGCAAWPSFETVQRQHRSAYTQVLDRHGALLQTVRSDPKVLRMDWVGLAQVSPALRHALLLSEDRNFHAHSGVDWAAVSAAAWGNLWNTRTRGASTVTMQLVGLLDEDLAGAARRAGPRSLGEKVSQAGGALQLEQQWRKDQILEAYLNLVSFRGEVVGVGALSNALFQKQPSGLDAVESALAAALLRAPNASPALVARRACEVLRQQQRGSDCQAADALATRVLSRPPQPRPEPGTQLAPHLARRLMAQAGQAPEIRSTLDAGVQRVAREALQRHLAVLETQNVRDGAVIAIDNATGEVLAWVGSSGEISSAPEVDHVMAPRQAGSTLKPFLYQMAMERRWLTAASLLDDAPLDLSTVNGLYIPQNYDRRYKGLVSVRSALAASLNIPAVRTLQMVSPERFAERLQSLGLALPHEPTHYGYSLALGAAEVRLADLANAYRSLAQGGRWSPLRLQPARPAAVAGRAVMDPAASFIVADILADREARVATFGLSNALAARYWAAVKTGTSKDMRDNWCVGFTARHTVGVWVGNAQGDPMWDVSGTSGAAPVWRTVMDALEQSTPARAGPAPTPPPGLLQATVQFAGDVEPTRQEWFLRGTEMARIEPASPAGAAGRLILQPAAGTIIALDPDIPPGAQKLRFKAVAAQPAGWRWQLNGRVLGPATERTWSLWPGKHQLALIDARGRALESISFEVRGATLKAPAAQPGS